MTREELALSQEQVPHFTAMAVFPCKKNRLYRVYVRPDELVCIWAGSGDASAVAQHVGIHGGLVGALIGSFVAKMLDPSKKNAARKQVLDSTLLEELIPDHKMNLLARIIELNDARFVTASRFKNPADKAVLLIRHRSLGKLHLGFPTVEDVECALRELPPLLGGACRIEIQWSEKDKKFIKRRN